MLGVILHVYKFNSGRMRGERKMYYSTKTYGTDRGLSCCFRQWKASHSHCSTLHGYSIGIKLIFQSDTLDDRNWVMDFGGLKQFKEWSEGMFDHTLLIAKDDPFLDEFIRISKLEKYMLDGSPQVYGKPHERGALVDLRIVNGVGCEAFAKLCFDKMSELLVDMKKDNRGRYPVGSSVVLKSAEVFEHAGNSAIYERDYV